MIEHAIEHCPYCRQSRMELERMQKQNEELLKNFMRLYESSPQPYTRIVVTTDEEMKKIREDWRNEAAHNG